MAGARIEITKDTARPALKRAIAQLEGEGRELMLADIGEYLLRSTRERGARQVDPSGAPWRPLSEDYKKWKQKKRPGVPILKFDFHMLGDQLSYQVDSDALYVGTNAPYGAVHQFGHTFERKARKQELFFHRDRGGEVGNLFVKKRKSNFAQTVDVGAHQGVLPARPWLGLSDEDHDEVLAIAADYLAGMFGSD